MNAEPTRSNLNLESYSLRNMYLSVFVVKMLYIYIGMMLVWTSPLVPNLEVSLHLSTMEKIMILACLPLGMMIGPITGKILVSRYGFKPVFLEIGCLSLASVLLLTFPQVLVICLGRFSAGVAIGTFLCYTKPYIQEISDLEVRTVMNPLTLGLVALGTYLVYDLSQILCCYKMLMIVLIAPIVLLFCLTWLPESPYFYVTAGRLEKAKKSVDFLHRGISTNGLDLLTHNIQEEVSQRDADANNCTNTDPKSAYVTLAFFGLLPLTGFPVILMLMETLVSEAQQQVAVESSLLVIARISLCPIPIAWIFNYYCGHKLQMIGSSVVMSLSMMALGIYFISIETKKDMLDMSWIPLICIVFYMTAFLVGFVHKSDDSVSEPRLQGCGQVLALTVSFFTMFLVVLIFFPLKSVLGTGPILCMFSAFSMSLSIFIGIYSPAATLF